VQQQRAEPDAEGERELLRDRRQRGRVAHGRLVDVGVGERVLARELQRAEEAADQQDGGDQQVGRGRPEQPVRRHEARAQHGVRDQHAPEAEPAQDRRG
jgi:hypothetical protein